jgi:hypothetical protein
MGLLKEKWNETSKNSQKKIKSLNPLKCNERLNEIDKKKRGRNGIPHTYIT